MRKSLVRTSTVAVSLNVLLKGQLSFLNNHYKVTALSGQDENLKEVEQREKVIIYGVEMQRQISPIKDVLALIKLYRYFSKTKPLIVHSITPKAGLLTMLAGKMARVPIRMHTFTGLIFPTRTGLMQNLLITMDQLLCWSATNVYPEGNGVKEDLFNFNITSKPLKVLANGNVNGIDLDFFNPNQVERLEQQSLRRQLGFSDHDFIYVFVGRLVRDKGINELVEAFSTVSKDKSNVKLLLVGAVEAELDPLALKTIEGINSNPNIVSVGFQKDVRTYFAISNCLVFPSYREGFPNVVLQAGAMGLPSIVTNINGSNEIIINGENGIIIPVKDVVSLVDSMQKMESDLPFFLHLQSKSRDLIVKRYKQSIVWNALLKEYIELEQKYYKGLK